MPAPKLVKLSGKPSLYNNDTSRFLPVVSMATISEILLLFSELASEVRRIVDVKEYVPSVAGVKPVVWLYVVSEPCLNLGRLAVWV